MKNQFFTNKLKIKKMKKNYAKECAISTIGISILSYIIGMILITFIFSFQPKEKKQCKGITLKKEQCKRMLLVTNKSNYCYQHLKQDKK